MNTRIINIEEAQGRGYSPVTDPYTPQETEMLDRACRDLAGCDYLLVSTPQGIAIYRKRVEMNKLEAFPV